MKNIKYIVAAFILSVLALAPFAYAAIAPLATPQGGTGTTTKPTLGQVLVGQSNGTYAPRATSTLGFAPLFTTSASLAALISDTVGTGSVTLNSSPYFLGNVAIGSTTGTHALTFPATSTGIAIYNTADQTTNYERGIMQWVGNILTLGYQGSGTGANRNVRLQSTSGNGVANGYIQLNQSGAFPHFQFVEPATTLTNAGVGAIDESYGFTQSAAGTQIAHSLRPALSQGGGAGYTVLFINPTETTTGTGTKLLIQAGTSTNQSMFVVSNLGRVGVGTTTPAGIFDISGSSGSTNLVAFDPSRSISLINRDSTIGNAQGIALRSLTASGTLQSGVKLLGVNTARSAIGLTSDFAILTNNDGTISEKMRVLSSGSVGIGTTTPSSALTVVGTTTSNGLSITSTTTRALLAGGLTLSPISVNVTPVQLLLNSNGAGFSVGTGDTNGLGLSIAGTELYRFRNSELRTTQPIVWGTSANTLGDTNLYRATTSTLRTDTNFTVGGTTTLATTTFSLMTPSRALFVGAANNVTSTGTSAFLTNALTDETGNGLAVFNNGPTLSTPRIAQVLGGTAVSSSLTLQTTSASGTSDFIALKVGANGAIDAMRVTTLGLIGIGTTTPTSLFTVASSTGTSTIAIDTSTSTRGGCIKMKNRSGIGYSYLTVEAGVLSASTVSCE